MATILYKYLDVKGGLAMLEYHNLQFTNATCLNDPFDCHPSLIDFSKIPAEKTKMWSKELSIELDAQHFRHQRDKAWVCSLSKIHDSILMWSYYGNHKGVCIGIDMDKTKKYLSNIHCQLCNGAREMEVQYRDVIDKPDFYRNFVNNDLFKYQLCTKAKAWKHEQEVRLLLIDPCYGWIPTTEPEHNKDEAIDYKNIRFHPQIGGECFDSLYLGIKVDDEEKEKIIKVAKKLNPEIKIYQMTIDPEAFRLKEEIIEK